MTRPHRPLVGAACIAALAFGLLICAGSSAGAQPLQAGERIPFRAETPHPYTAGTGAIASFQVPIYHPGATYIAVHFDRFDLGPGDRVVVRSLGGGQRYTFTGRGRADQGAFWATHIKGDAAVVELHSPSPRGGAWGFSIDQYAAGFVDLGTESIQAPETVCGPDDRANNICYQGTEASAYDHTRPVARLLIEGTFWCTGWLVGCEGHLLTNNHCIDDPLLSDPATAAANTDYEFLAEAPYCGSANNEEAWDGTVWPGSASLVQRSTTLDYAFILLDGDPQATYGSLVLEDRTAFLGEQIYLPQHGLGKAREMALESSDPNDAGGVCRVFRNNEASCTGGFPEVGYFCDTDPGSSGTPVIAYSNHKVIALHHCGGCPGGRNTATAIFRVIDDLGALLPASATAPDAVCGDGALQCGELCDGAMLGAEACSTQGFTSGSLACNNSCDGFVTSGCVSTCGDTEISPDEECEGANLNGQSCIGLGFAGGALSCDGACQLDTSGCFSVCGDALVSPDEACDGGDLDGQNCATQGLDSGTLSCNAGCTGFDIAGCCGPIDLVAICLTAGSGSPTRCDASDATGLSFLKPSPAGVGVDLYRIDESDFFPGGTGPVDCLGNDLEAGTAPGAPVYLIPPVYAPTLGEVAYYVVSCHQCGSLTATGIGRFGQTDTERLIGISCTPSCP